MNETTMSHTKEILSLKNPSFCAYMICSAILILKMIAVAILTGYRRFRNKAFASPEDAKFNNGQVQENDLVERAKRAHLNDLENIPLFWTSGLVYLFVKPPAGLACFMFFTFTLVRVVHTIIYAVFVIRQPARAICWLTGLLIVAYMCLHAMIVGFIHI